MRCWFGIWVPAIVRCDEVQEHSANICWEREYTIVEHNIALYIPLAKQSGWLPAGCKVGLNYPPRS